MGGLDRQSAYTVWEKRRDTMVAVIALLAEKPNPATWTDAEKRTYFYARAISRRVNTTN